MRVLVTGGAGFIGSALIRFLINNTNFHVLNIDKLSYASNLEALASIANNSRYHFFKYDICDAEAIKTVFETYIPDAVIHLAAESHVDRSIASSLPFIQSNILGTYYLLEISRNYWSNLDITQRHQFRFIHVSTDEVYGDLETNAPAFTEEHPYRPSSPYSASKASSDHLVRAWHRTYHFPAIITNCSNNYGPYQYPEKLIPLTIFNALNERAIQVYGDGNQIRDWLHVDDHVRALYQVLMNGEIGGHYNIGGNSEIKNIDVVGKICSFLDILNPKISGTYAEQIRFVQDRRGHDRRYAINNALIRERLAWEPLLDFETGIFNTVEWYLSKWRTMLHLSEII